ncbi:MAG: hypothetical protein WA323_12905 [Candidatus Nitrosopolaris sp.]
MESIDLENKSVEIRSSVLENPINPIEMSLRYDYLVIAVGSETRFFGTTSRIYHKLSTTQ